MVEVYVFIKSWVITTFLKWRLWKKFKKKQDYALFLKEMSEFKCPYKIAANYYQKLNKNPFVYGHTPLWSVYQIFNLFSFKENVRVVDFGAGDFQVVFFLRKIFSFSVKGIECIPEFCQQARNFLKKSRLEKVEIHEGNYLNISSIEADVGFLFGSNLEDQEILRLLPKITNIPLFITVSFPLSDYSDAYELIAEKKVWFLFGRASVYFQKRINI